MNDRLLRALAREPVDATPVWFMRQAGRYLPEYRELRKDHELYDIMRDPGLSAEVTAMPVERFDVDAAILFSDISIPLPPAGLDVEMVKGVGPTIDDPIESVEDVDALEPVDFEEATPFLIEEIEILKDRLDVPVIGFAGGPFTLATYAIDGRGKRSVPETRATMVRDPKTWEATMRFFADLVADLLVAQYEAGADVVQVFDSWIGVLNGEAYWNHVHPWSKRVFDRLAQEGIPSIHFGTGNPYLYPLMAEAGGDAIGVDWRTPLDSAWDTLEHDRAIQGNLDPAALCGPVDHAVEEASKVLGQAGGRDGHIFNLGHGVLPQTRPECVEAVIETVHEGAGR